MNSQPLTHSQTDMMRRRTQLPFCGTFLWRGARVSIRTNSQSVLLAAEQEGFLPSGDCECEPEMRWEIVCERLGDGCRDSRDRRVMSDDHSLFLVMGGEQWFALDLETGDGAGFIALAQDEVSSRSHAVEYLLDITRNIATLMRNETGGAP